MGAAYPGPSGGGINYTSAGGPCGVHGRVGNANSHLTRPTRPSTAGRRNIGTPGAKFEEPTPEELEEARKREYQRQQEEIEENKERLYKYTQEHDFISFDLMTSYGWYCKKCYVGALCRGAEECVVCRTSWPYFEMVCPHCGANKSYVKNWDDLFWDKDNSDDPPRFTCYYCLKCEREFYLPI